MGKNSSRRKQTASSSQLKQKPKEEARMKPNNAKILRDLQILTETKERKNLEDIKAKIACGFYSQPKVLNKVAARILRELSH